MSRKSDAVPESALKYHGYRFQIGENFGPAGKRIARKSNEIRPFLCVRKGGLKITLEGKMEAPRKKK